MSIISTCLWFDTEGEEAARFYVDLFPNSELGTILRYGAENPEREGQVLTVEFVLDGAHFMALNGGPQFTFDEAVSFPIRCADQAEVDRYWDALVADGGQESDCGWCKDRFGVSWQVTPTVLTQLLTDPDPERAARAMQSMLTMQRIDVATLQAAVEG